MQKDSTPKAVKVDGIEVSPRVDPSDDFDVAVAVARVMDDSAGGYEKVRAMDSALSLILGDDKGRVMGELRAKGGGRLTHRAVGEFFGHLMQSGRELKNS